MIKRYWVVILFLVSLIVFLISRYYNHQKEAGNVSHLKAQTFQTSYGWGYDVMINDSVFIHQEFIPGVPGKQGFKTELQALSVGNLVVKKMNERKGFPTVNPKELDSLGVKQ